MFTLQKLRTVAASAGAMVIASAVAMYAQAGPANFKPIVVEQPDGTTIAVRIQGDEFQGWMETADGYTIVANPATGYFEYATVGAEGQLVPSGLRALPDAAAHGTRAAGLPPQGLRPPRNLDKEAFQNTTIDSILQQRIEAGRPAVRSPSGNWAPVPVSGTRKMLAILVSFSDQAIGNGSNNYWYGTLFDPAANSVVKYYTDNSWGKLSIQPVAHTQPGSPNGIVNVTLPSKHPNCKDEGEQGNCSYATETAVINAALAAAATWVNFPALDTNGDGEISRDEALFYFIWAGYEASGSALTPSIWAHAWGGQGVAVSGKTVPVWAINGEWYSATSRMGMGVVTHELGHQMGGLPDLYDTSKTNKGLGMFSVMAGGSWGGKEGEVGGTTATGLDAWSRQFLGWSNVQTPTPGQVATMVSGLASKNSAFMLINEAISSSEYWLVENRPPLNWDAGIWAGFNPLYPDVPSVNWAGGLLIQHIDLAIGTPIANDFNKYVRDKHQGNVVVEPSTVTAACSLTASDKTDGSGCPTLLYSQGNGTAFNDLSTPNSRYYNGTPSNFGVGAASPAGSSMTVIFSTDVMRTATVSARGNGLGRVTSSTGGINCGSACSGLYSQGSVLTLTAATPWPGSVFESWGGACSGTDPVCQVAVAGVIDITARFRYSGTIGSWNSVRDAYLSYYGRPGDPGGLAYWAGQTDASGGTLAAIMAALGTSAEFNSRYGGLTSTQLVTRIYQQTLARDPDEAGLNWYVAELNAGRKTLQSIALDVLYGATGIDAITVSNKRVVADYYTDKVAAGCAYGGEQAGVDALKNVTSDAATIVAAKAAIDLRCAQ